MSDSEFKACPFCKEQIRALAIKCRFCGEWLERPPDVKAATIRERSKDSELGRSTPKAEAPLPAQRKRSWHSLTLGQQIIIAVGLGLLGVFLYNSFAILSPLGLGCIVILVGLFYRFRIPPDRGTEEDGYELLEHATRLEHQGQIQDALKAYDHIANRYAGTDPGLDAQKSADTLRKRAD